MMVHGNVWSTPGPWSALQCGVGRAAHDPWPGETVEQHERRAGDGLSPPRDQGSLSSQS